MACFKPIKAFRDASGTLFFSSRPGTNVFKVPCGQCVGCRLERSRQWAARCMHEAALHDENCFLTLTYRPDVCPVSLRYEDFQLFMKRVRKQFYPRRVRFYMCGEYGENTKRAHFHVLLFGVNFSDRVRWSGRLWRSAMLERLWPFGFSTIGEVTFESAAYTARYVMKKITGGEAEAHYRFVDPVTGEVIDRVPEFCHMSLKPGIGAGWLERYHSDVFPSGTMVVRGVESKSARYYDKLYRRVDRAGFDVMKAGRVESALDRYRDNYDDRLKVREVVTAARVRLLKRDTFGD